MTPCFDIHVHAWLNGDCSARKFGIGWLNKAWVVFVTIAFRVVGVMVGFMVIGIRMVGIRMIRVMMGFLMIAVVSSLVEKRLTTWTFGCGWAIPGCRSTVFSLRGWAICWLGFVVSGFGWGIRSGFMVSGLGVMVGFGFVIFGFRFVIRKGRFVRSRLFISWLGGMVGLRLMISGFMICRLWLGIWVIVPIRRIGVHIG